MATIQWYPPSDKSCYGHDVTAEDMDAMDALQFEFLESLGHTVEMFGRTNSSQAQRHSEELDDEELHELSMQAWHYAYSNYKKG